MTKIRCWNAKLSRIIFRHQFFTDEDWMEEKRMTPWIFLIKLNCYEASKDQKIMSN